MLWRTEAEEGFVEPFMAEILNTTCVPAHDGVLASHPISLPPRYAPSGKSPDSIGTPQRRPNVDAHLERAEEGFVEPVVPDFDNPARKWPIPTSKFRRK